MDSYSFRVVEHQAVFAPVQHASTEPAQKAEVDILLADDVSEVEDTQQISESYFAEKEGEEIYHGIVWEFLLKHSDVWESKFTDLVPMTITLKFNGYEHEDDQETKKQWQNDKIDTYALCGIIFNAIMKGRSEFSFPLISDPKALHANEVLYKLKHFIRCHNRGAHPNTQTLVKQALNPRRMLDYVNFRPKLTNYSKQQGLAALGWYTACGVGLYFLAGVVMFQYMPAFVILVVCLERAIISDLIKESYRNKDAKEHDMNLWAIKQQVDGQPLAEIVYKHYKQCSSDDPSSNGSNEMTAL